MKTALATLSLLFASAAFSADKPNIIFIMADDLGWQDVGFAGAKFFETPHIDKLPIARESV